MILDDLTFCPDELVSPVLHRVSQPEKSTIREGAFQMLASRARQLFLGFLILSLLIVWPIPHADADTSAVHYAGWAVEAYPELSSTGMESMVRRMVQNGANVVWIGHNNPGEVDAAKVEPGLSYAVYEAYRDLTDPRHEPAVAVVEAQHRILAACRAVGVKAVLPIGYQIQMGQVWNENHPDDLRRDAMGQPLNIFGGGVSASFYAASFRRDIEAYYRWVDAEFVQPYADVLLMLNLADEPIGGDYSTHAELEFRRRSGFGFADAGDDPARQRLLGEFQSRYVVEYAIYSAEQWQAIHPGLPVTMSFDGAQARAKFTLPDVEALFRETPSNFVVTFDAYPHDGLPTTALDDGDLVSLFLLVRSLGLYSARYNRPLWLWAAANSWGLSQASPDPGTVSDAVANGLYLAFLARETGGDLQGIAYWNYNVKEQGLYNNAHATTYDSETMFAQVSAVLPTVRRLMDLPPSHPEVLVLAPPARSYERIGAERAAVSLEVQPFRRLAILARDGVSSAVVDSLGDAPLAGIRAIVVLAPTVDDLSALDAATLRRFLTSGGKVVTSPDVGKALAGVTHAVPKLICGQMVEQWGNLYVAQKGIAVLFEDQRHDVLSDFWRVVLGLEAPQPAYRIVTDEFAFLYHIGPEPATVQLEMPFEVFGYRYDEQAQPAKRLYGSVLTLTLGRREYILLKRDRWAWPWFV
jgi:hypothetical protein